MPTVYTGAIALIRVRGTAIGHMRNFNITENFELGTVKGIGTIYTIEAPVVGHAGTGNANFYTIDYTTSPFVESIRRNMQTAQQFQDQLTLLDSSFTLDLFKKESDVVDPDTGLAVPKLSPFASVTKVIINSDGFDISEGSVSGRNISFIFLDPILKRA